jgi:hypothetical protein
MISMNAAIFDADKHLLASKPEENGTSSQQCQVVPLHAMIQALRLLLHSQDLHPLSFPLHDHDTLADHPPLQLSPLWNVPFD